MHRTPDPSNVLIHTNHIFASDQFVLLPAVRHKKLDFLQNLILLEVSQAHGLLAAVDEVRLDDGVFIRARRYPELGARVSLSEGCEERGC